ncbi:hypothetical protein A2363_01825 [Candidatus Gottesmanbacteria bacterium RIFOXYB1_FULL_47_11]|uniref:BD-FAE-like domain-containing protein n=1 Tax=Candidatus Gottesmanbacteria bacterium RIFOXYB1_FULL_47_11 TaxID=1798401 RepID=A0A1F6BDG4_9BACT|nr:MAG: hypothetical protein A2363_01825 [Candidatus Gottesmanbacteria bacterium RIFOXYB1_FULL_47_11]
MSNINRYQIKNIVIINAVVILCLIAARSTYAAETNYNTRLDLTYKTIENLELKIDICLPKNNSNMQRPTIAFFHGGGLRAGSRKDGFPSLCELVTPHGYNVASADYRLAPDHKYPDLLDDAQYVIRWLKQHAETYRIDPNRIIVAGVSAGASLASVVGTRNDTRNPAYGLPSYSSKPQGTIVVSGAYDFTDPNLLGSFNPTSYSLGGNQNYVNEFSAVTHISSDDGPFLLVHGDADITALPVQSEWMYEMLQEVNIPARLIMLPGRDHFGIYQVLLEPTVQTAIMAYLNQYFTVGSPTTTPIPTSSPAGNIADLTDEGDTPDNQVNEFDYNVLVGDFGKTGSPGWIKADIIKNGKVDEFDYNALVGNFGV